MSLIIASAKEPLVPLSLQLRLRECDDESVMVKISWSTTAEELVGAVSQYAIRSQVARKSSSAAIVGDSSSASSSRQCNTSTGTPSDVSSEPSSTDTSPLEQPILSEIVCDSAGDICKERRMSPDEHPAQVRALWPDDNELNRFGFLLSDDSMRSDEDTAARRVSSSLTSMLDCELAASGFSADSFLGRFFSERRRASFPDLTQLTDLTERSLVDNLRRRFHEGRIYTYAGPSILVSINPYKFFPLYNPKVVSLYQNHPFPAKLPPHVFAIADEAHQEMLRTLRDQCVVISGKEVDLLRVI